MTCNCDDNPLSRFGIGKLQRQTPLPPGTYWIDVIGDVLIPAFTVWSFENANTVGVIATEHFEGGLEVGENGQGVFIAPRNWIKFQVTSPTPWDAKRFGFPNIIAPGEIVNSSSDTVTGMEPDPDECDAECKLERAAIAVAVIAVGAIVLTIAVKR